MSSFIGNTPTLAARRDFVYTATAGQTVFSGVDSQGLPLVINGANFDVFVNGVMLARADISATTTTSVTLALARNAADVVTVRCYGFVESIANVLTTVNRPTQNTATWQAGTDTTPSTPSAKDVRDAIAAVTLGVGQTWQDLTASRATNTAYQNTTGKPIAVTIQVSNATATGLLQVSTDNSTWVTMGGVWSDSSGSVRMDSGMAIVPPGHYYRFNGTAPMLRWTELR